MEDVWKDIILSPPLQHSPLSPNPNSACKLEAPRSRFCGVGHQLASSTAILNWASDHHQHPKPGSEGNKCPVDRIHRRMMKNRESAAQSRARRLAYTFELEKDKSELTEENARMRKELQQQELFLAAAASAVEKEAPKNRNLSRSMSALF